MRTGRSFPLTALVSAGFALALPAFAAETPRARVVTLRQAQQSFGTLAPAGADVSAPRTGQIVARSRGTLDAQSPRISYSVELPQISRVQGLALYRTAVDISNNTTSGGVVARFQYAYQCLACSGGGGFFRTAERSVSLRALDSFHSDDFVDYLNSLGVLEPGARDGSFGTLLVTFDGLPSATGWEGTVVARNYNRLVEGDPNQGTVGYAYPASLFFESANDTVVGTIHDTTPAPTLQGSQRTNLGVRNTDINGTNANVNVQITFIDVTFGSGTNGQPVGNAQAFNDLRPGEVRQISNVFTVAAIPDAVTSVIAFADVTAGPTNATIEGYVNVIDNTTQDGAFFEMKCADANGCGN